jgi:hypothetical protein
MSPNRDKTNKKDLKKVVKEKIKKGIFQWETEKEENLFWKYCGLEKKND